MTKLYSIPEQLVFPDDGKFPNSKLPVLIYRNAFKLSDDLSDLFEQTLAGNAWTNSWRDGVFDYHHYHSTSHEVLAVGRGRATLQLGGPAVGSHVELTAGDVLVIPAGVAHKALEHSSDFEVVGAYPKGSDWDILRGLPGERPAADQRIARLPIPTTDPVYGSDGPLVDAWKS